jgi:hypothetical protein
MGRVEPAPITSLQWNSLGTQLATSGQDVRIWRGTPPSQHTIMTLFSAPNSLFLLNESPQIV